MRQTATGIGDAKLTPERPSKESTMEKVRRVSGFSWLSLPAHAAAYHCEQRRGRRVSRFCSQLVALPHHGQRRPGPAINGRRSQGLGSGVPAAALGSDGGARKSEMKLVESATSQRSSLLSTLHFYVLRRYHRLLSRSASLMSRAYSRRASRTSRWYSRSALRTSR